MKRVDKCMNECVNIEFYLIDAFEISHFEPLYHFFSKKGANVVFVAEPCEWNTSGNWFDYDCAIERLKQKKLRYKTECDPQAQIAFTTQESNILKKYWFATKRVNLCYGSSLLRESFFSSLRSTEGFDYKLVHGVYDQKLCLEKVSEAKVRVIGYPRHYELKRDRFHTEEIRRELGIETEKKIILYMPTWDEHASICTYREAFMELRKSYYIVTKPHHCTYRLKSKQVDLKILYEISDMVLDAAYNFEKAAFIGDITMVDAKSGAALETCFINPDVKMIWLSPQKNVRSYFVDEAFTMAELINEPQKLKGTVSGMLSEDKYQNVRREQIFRFFADETGESLEKVYEEMVRDCAEEYRRDTNYWNAYYRGNPDIKNPSLFAQTVGRMLEQSKSILDLGCGNGRDSVYFAGLGLKVTAIDASDAAITQLRKEHGEGDINFICDDFVSSSEVYAGQYDYVYSRFTLHAINESQETKVLNNIYQVLKQDGKFFIEVRSVNDEIYGLGEAVGPDSYIYEGHYRRFIRIEQLEAKIKEAGFEIMTAVEQRGFAPYQESDPPIIRITAQKK